MITGHNLSIGPFAGTILTKAFAQGAAHSGTTSADVAMLKPAIAEHHRAFYSALAQFSKGAAATRTITAVDPAAPATQLSLYDTPASWTWGYGSLEVSTPGVSGIPCALLDTALHPRVHITPYFPSPAPNSRSTLRTTDRSTAPAAALLLAQRATTTDAPPGPQVSYDLDAPGWVVHALSASSQGKHLRPGFARRHNAELLYAYYCALACSPEASRDLIENHLNDAAAEGYTPFLTATTTTAIHAHFTPLHDDPAAPHRLTLPQHHHAAFAGPANPLARSPEQIPTGGHSKPGEDAPTGVLSHNAITATIYSAIEKSYNALMQHINPGYRPPETSADRIQRQRGALEQIRGAICVTAPPSGQAYVNVLERWLLHRLAPATECVVEVYGSKNSFKAILPSPSLAAATAEILKSPAFTVQTRDAVIEVPPTYNIYDIDVPGETDRESKTYKIISYPNNTTPPHNAMFVRSAEDNQLELSLRTLGFALPALYPQHLTTPEPSDTAACRALLDAQNSALHELAETEASASKHATLRANAEAIASNQTATNAARNIARTTATTQETHLKRLADRAAEFRSTAERAAAQLAKATALSADPADPEPFRKACAARIANCLRAAAPGAGIPPRLALPGAPVPIPPGPNSTLTERAAYREAFLSPEVQAYLQNFAPHTKTFGQTQLFFPNIGGHYPAGALLMVYQYPAEGAPGPIINPSFLYAAINLQNTSSSATTLTAMLTDPPVYTEPPWTTDGTLNWTFPPIDNPNTAIAAIKKQADAVAALITKASADPARTGAASTMHSAVCKALREHYETLTEGTASNTLNRRLSETKAKHSTSLATVYRHLELFNSAQRRYTTSLEARICTIPVGALKIKPPATYEGHSQLLELIRILSSADIAQGIKASATYTDLWNRAKRLEKQHSDCAAHPHTGRPLTLSASNISDSLAKLHLYPRLPAALSNYTFRYEAASALLAVRQLATNLAAVREILDLSATHCNTHLLEQATNYLEAAGSPDSSEAPAAFLHLRPKPTDPAPESLDATVVEAATEHLNTVLNSYIKHRAAASKLYAAILLDGSAPAQYDDKTRCAVCGDNHIFPSPEGTGILPSPYWIDSPTGPVHADCFVRTPAAQSPVAQSPGKVKRSNRKGTVLQLNAFTSSSTSPAPAVSATAHSIANILYDVPFLVDGYPNDDVYACHNGTHATGIVFHNALHLLQSLNSATRN